MVIKQCFKCRKKRPLKEFYKHKEMADGHLNKCKECTKWDNKVSNGIHQRRCVACSKEFRTTASEIRRGGGNSCSRVCWFKHFRTIVKREEESPNWKGDRVGISALHDWIKRQRGKPKICEHCGTLTAKKYEWANKSRGYKRELNDWIRLCTKCHVAYDYEVRMPKWKKGVSKYGWKLTNSYAVK